MYSTSVFRKELLLIVFVEITVSEPIELEVIEDRSHY